MKQQQQHLRYDKKIINYSDFVYYIKLMNCTGMCTCKGLFFYTT